MTRVDTVGVVMYAIAAVYYAAAACQMWGMMRQGKSAVARALGQSLIYMTAFCLYAICTIVTRYIWREWQPLIANEVAFVMRLLFAAIALVIWRSLQRDA